MDFHETTKYRIALSMSEKIGSVRAKQLIAYCGSAEAVFNESKKALLKIPGISNGLVSKLHQTDFERVEAEIAFIKKNDIQVLFYLDDDYPLRLKQYEDAPVCLFYKGNAALNGRKHISVVGTRTPTDRGKWICEKLVEDFSKYNINIFSGLAYGIDAAAHKASIKFGLPTIGVVAHGLDNLYPSVHKSLAKEMLENGGLLTEFPSNTNPDRERFPARNRIIAGISDAVIVVESKKSGGSIITANFANDYNKDVFAIPGRIQDEYSKGCNRLIKEHKAFLLESAEELIKMMRWEKKNEKEVQRSLFFDLTRDEQKIVELIKIGIDDIDGIANEVSMKLSDLAGMMLELEFKGVIKSIPGKRYIHMN